MNKNKKRYFYTISRSKCRKKFLEDAASIELSPLLSNPLFLKLFSKSYVENNQCFENRHSAFKLAIEGLAKENNRGYSYDRNILPASKKN